MSALAFPPAPTLPRPSVPTRVRSRRRPTAPCRHRERHLRAMPTGPAVPTPAVAPNLPESTPANAPSMAPAPAAATPVSLAPAPQLAPERDRVAQEVPLRLSARGRRVMVAAAFALAIGLGSLAGVLFPSQQPMPEQVQDVVVMQGESLWVIASSVAAPGQDVREVVEQIRALNGLEQSTLMAGQTLTIPAD